MFQDIIDLEYLGLVGFIVIQTNHFQHGTIFIKFLSIKMLSSWCTDDHIVSTHASSPMFPRRMRIRTQEHCMLRLIGQLMCSLSIQIINQIFHCLNTKLIQQLLFNLLESFIIIFFIRTSKFQSTFSFIRCFVG